MPATDLKQSDRQKEEYHESDEVHHRRVLEDKEDRGSGGGERESGEKERERLEDMGEAGGD